MKAKKILQILIYIFLFSFWSSVKAQDYNSTKANIIGPNNFVVNSYTGNLHYQRNDLLIPGRGLGIDMTFSYNTAQRSKNWGFGNGWTLTYNMAYTIDSLGVIIERMDGSRDLFIDQEGEYTAKAGVFDQLAEYESSKYKLRAKNGTTYYFENPDHQRLTKIEDRNGNTLTFINGDSTITSIIDPSGRMVDLIWENGRLAKITIQSDSQRTVHFEYDEDGNPIRVTNPEGGYVEYFYNEANVLTGMIDENGNRIEIEYTDLMAVKRISSCLSTMNIIYDFVNTKTHVTERVGGETQITTYEYDQNGRLLSQQGNCCNNSQSYTYDENDNVMVRKDANGNATFYSYDASGNIIQEIDAMGSVQTYAYEPEYNQITKHTDKNGNETVYEYDDQGNLINILYASGDFETMAYDEFGNKVTHTDGNNRTTTHQYDQNGYLIKTINAIGASKEMVYDGVGNLIQETDFNGNTTQFQYDALNQLVEETDALGHKRNFEYDNRGNIISFKDKNGYVSNLTYNENDQLIEIETPLGFTEKFSYDARGNLLSHTDRNGHKTIYKYDQLNRVVAQKNAEEEETQFDYDLFGNLTTVSAPNGSVIALTYDKLNRITSIEDQIGDIVRFSYDKNGNVLSRTDGNGNSVAYTHDKLNRIIEVTDPLGNKATYDYDRNGNIVSVTDRNGNTKSATYDAQGRRMTTSDNLGNPTSFSYDNNGNLIVVTDANNNETTYEYDPLNRLIKEIFPDGTTIEFTLNAIGLPIARKDNKGQVTNYTYDEMYRLLSRSYPDGTKNEFTYDSENNILEARNQHAYITMAYDKANRLISESINGRTTHFNYDTEGRERLIKYPGGKEIIEQLDERTRLVTVLEDNQERELIASYEYDLNDQVVNRAFANNTITNYKYDTNNRISEISHTLNRTIQYNYSYDAIGNRLSEIHLHQPENSILYQYDNLYQLTGAIVGTISGGNIANPVRETQYTFDALGNRRSITENGNTINYSSNNLNQYTSLSGSTNTTINYDLNGNPEEIDGFRFTYGYENQLLEVNDGDIAEYQYGPLGRRIKKIIGADTTYYFYDYLRVIEELGNNGMLKASYVYGKDLDEALVMTRENDAYFYYRDGTGSIRILAGQQGAIVEQYEYDDYGKPYFFNAAYQTLNASVFSNPFLFNGREYDKETSQYFYRARTLSPKVGRFLQRDPTGFVDGPNVYNYVSNNPVVYTDPFGLWRHYGNWGGPGWTNGTNQWTENDDFPRQGEPGYEPPIDARDECYYYHDVCLNDCVNENCDSGKLQQCKKNCHLELADCIWWLPGEYYNPYTRLYDPLYNEVILFKYILPTIGPLIGF